MQNSVDRCALWSGPARQGLAAWVFEEAANATSEVAEAAAIRAGQEAGAPPQAYTCKAPLITMLARRMKRIFEQPPQINLLLTAIYKSLLEVSSPRMCQYPCRHNISAMLKKLKSLFKFSSSFRTSR
jgi:hypothetical protein